MQSPCSTADKSLSLSASNHWVVNIEANVELSIVNICIETLKRGKGNLSCKQHCIHQAGRV